ncbi:sh3 domain-containing [Holotrichia oblita]|uniref:Sh3 domain-containing n=1 Tax=Holotrichia oblita TaxID=644536 RepID=A0ACB9T809_HOLOL|nr:sh3 domain-containing [Holotrichia oblita]
MDEGTLNDLLECSVCLERLDTSSKVLPCQHTFCRKCLEEIVEKHKELRCPECRILIHSKIDDLPPNVLLMRILEGMRNAAPKKQSRNIRENHTQQPFLQHTTPIHQALQGAPDHRHKTNRPVQQHYLTPQQPYAKALYDYTSKEQGDLNFKRGEIIILRKRIDSNWYQGECGGKEGVFPLSYVQIITPVPSNIPQCKALYDFRMTNDEEEGCLAFNKGDIINVIRRVDENWAEGKLDGRIGIFPLAFVELNSLARSLMKLSTNSQPGPSKVAPPTPTTEDASLLIMSDHSRTIGSIHVSHISNQHLQNHITQPQHQQQVQQLNAAIPASDSSSTVSSGSSSTTTPNTTSSNNSSNPSTAPSSPASPPTRNQQLIPPRNQKTEGFGTPQRQPVTANNLPPRPESHTHQQMREKRHSFTSLTPQHHSSNTHRLSAEILAPEANVQAQTSNTSYNGDRHRRSTELTPTEPATYIALYPYKPQKPDELELKKGGIYMVTERCQDGWFKGTSNRTQKCGVFPGNYVTLARGTPRSPQSSTTRTGDNNDGKGATNYSSKSGKAYNPTKQLSNLPPELPPRSASPACSTNTISSSWHGQQDNAAIALGRSSSAIMSSVTVQSMSPANNVGKSADKKEACATTRKNRKCKHWRYTGDWSGSCPSQLLQQVQPSSDHRIYASTSQRLKHKERPSLLAQTTRTGDNPTGSSGSSPDIHHHRKSNSLDAGSKNKTGTQTVRERFRCIAPYPPNSEYELELQVSDIIYVHKKRDDGWYKGTQQRTGRTGLFPASFVENF